MDFLWHINVEEMLGDLTVATFLVLLAASVAVVSLMLLFPLIDLAFEEKVKPAINEQEPWDQDGLATHDEAWQIGRPWLGLRSDLLRPDAVRRPQVTSDQRRKHAA